MKNRKAKRLFLQRPVRVVELVISNHKIAVLHPFGQVAIAASYTMHLYCDCRQCTEGVYPVPDFGEYIGTSWAGCAKEARKDGWRISKDKTRAFAPGHKVLRINK